MTVSGDISIIPIDSRRTKKNAISPNFLALFIIAPKNRLIGIGTRPIFAWRQP
jgi:hypothetical protein